jgi:hypothetical protein
MLLLCFLATGTQWDLMQVFAWGRMIAGHTQAMALSQAVAKTFDGEMCSLCRMVNDAKKQEQSRSNFPELKQERKMVLFFQAVPNVVVESPLLATWYPAEVTVVTAGRAAPPLPPPRAYWD